MQSLAYAVKIEAALREFLETDRPTMPASLQPVVDDLAGLQSRLELILDKATGCLDPASLPTADFAALVTPQPTVLTMKDLPDDDNAVAAAVLVLWMLSGALEKIAQYYSQAAANSAHPALQAFCRSLAEVKKISLRRLDGSLRILYNRIWERIGFAPYTLVK